VLLAAWADAAGSLDEEHEPGRARERAEVERWRRRPRKVEREDSAELGSAVVVFGRRRNVGLVRRAVVVVRAESSSRRRLRPRWRSGSGLELWLGAGVGE
jgi:hypothetical protein